MSLKCIYSTWGNMCTHMIWDISTYQKVSEVTSLLKEFVYIREFICLQMTQFYYHLRNYWKQIVPRIETNKRSALINFSGPLAQLSCLYDMWPTRLRTILQIILFYIHTGNPVYGVGLFSERCEVASFVSKYHENKTHVLTKLFFLWALSLFTQDALGMCLEHNRMLNRYHLIETAHTSKQQQIISDNVFRYTDIL